MRVKGKTKLLFKKPLFLVTAALVALFILVVLFVGKQLSSSVHGQTAQTALLQ